MRLLPHPLAEPVKVASTWAEIWRILWDISTVITSKLAELRGKVSADNLFSPSGANGQAFEDIFNEASLYFNEVCLTGCAADFSLVNGSATAREYVYDMTPDNPLKLAFDTLKGYSGSRAEILSIQSVISNDFKFEALPLDVCPYPPKRCVPMPGVGFTELTEGSSYCTFEMTADVVNALGSAMTDTMEALGIADLAASLSDTVGTWVGDFQTSIDAFLITLLASFLVGFILHGSTTLPCRRLRLDLRLPLLLGTLLRWCFLLHQVVAVLRSWDL